jgi:hypothetical protein
MADGQHAADPSTEILIRRSNQVHELTVHIYHDELAKTSPSGEEFRTSFPDGPGQNALCSAAPPSGDVLHVDSAQEPKTSLTVVESLDKVCVLPNTELNQLEFRASGDLLIYAVY